MPADMVGLSTPKAIQLIADYRKSIVRTIKDYEALFAEAGMESAIGDISPDYLYYCDESIRNIKKYLGSSVKIIIILRNPIDRAYSMYLLLKEQGLEELSFEEALKSEPERISKNWAAGYHLVNVSSYYRQVKAYLESFSHVKIYLYDDLKEETLRVVREVYSYLGVDGSFEPDINIKYNRSGVTRHIYFRKWHESRVFQKAVMFYFKMRRDENPIQAADAFSARLTTRKAVMSAGTRAQLRRIFGEEIAKLETLIGRNLGHWA